MENNNTQDAQPQQQPVVEEAQAAPPQQATDEAQAATSEVHDGPGIPQQQEQQQQGIAVGESNPNSPAVEPVSEEGLNPAETPDPAVTMSSDDLVGSDPKVTMNPEDLSGPQTAGDTSGFVAGDVTDASIEDDSIYEVFVEDEISPTVAEDDWDLGDAIRDSEPSDTEAVSTPPDKIADPAPTEPENTGVVPPWLQEPSNPLPTEPEDSRNPGDQEAERDGNESPENTGTNPEMSGEGGYTYDEGAYEDAEGAMKDLQHALKHGDEQERAEALEKLQGYLSGFDKGAEEEKQDGTETQDDQIPSDSENDSDGDHTEGGILHTEGAILGLDHELDSDGDGQSDLSEALGDLYWQYSDSDGDPEEVPNTVDKEAVDAPDASGAAVSGPAVGANAQEDPEDLGEGVMEDDGEGGIDPADVDYQEVLDDLDSGNLDDVRDFIKGLAGGNGEEEAKDAPGGGHEHGHLANEGISLGDIVGEKDDYAYDEGAYEDAEGAMKDLQHALKHGDEQERAEAIEKLQGYLGGFDKGTEKDQDGTKTQDDQSSSDSKDAYGDGIMELMKDSDGDGVENYRDSDHYRDGNFDFEDSDGNGILDLYEDSDKVTVQHFGDFDSDGDGIKDMADSDSDGDGIEDILGILDSDGDPEKVPNTVDNKEPADAPDASGAAVSGPAVGVAGAAVGAGAVGEAGDLGDLDLSNVFDDIFLGGSGNGDEKPEDAPDASGAAVSGPAVGAGDTVENIANGNFDGAIDAATQQAGGTIDEALGIEGSGKVLENVANGNFDGAIDAATEQAGGAIDEALGIEGSGEILENVLDGDFDEALEGIGEKVGDFFDDLNPF